MDDGVNRDAVQRLAGQPSCWTRRKYIPVGSSMAIPGHRRSSMRVTRHRGRERSASEVAENQSPAQCRPVLAPLPQSRRKPDQTPHPTSVSGCGRWRTVAGQGRPATSHMDVLVACPPPAVPRRAVHTYPRSGFPARSQTSSNLGPHMRKQNHITNRRRIGQQHH